MTMDKLHDLYKNSPKGKARIEALARAIFDHATKTNEDINALVGEESCLILKAGDLPGVKRENGEKGPIKVFFISRSIPIINLYLPTSASCRELKQTNVSCYHIMYLAKYETLPKPSEKLEFSHRCHNSACCRGDHGTMETHHNNISRNHCQTVSDVILPTNAIYRCCPHGEYCISTPTSNFFALYSHRNPSRISLRSSTLHHTATRNG